MRQGEVKIKGRNIDAIKDELPKIIMEAWQKQIKIKHLWKKRSSKFDSREGFVRNEKIPRRSNIANHKIGNTDLETNSEAGFSLKPLDEE